MQSEATDGERLILCQFLYFVRENYLLVSRENKRVLSFIAVMAEIMKTGYAHVENKLALETLLNQF